MVLKALAERIVGFLKPLGHKQGNLDVSRNAWAMKYYEAHRQYLPAISKMDFKFPEGQVIVIPIESFFLDMSGGVKHRGVGLPHCHDRRSHSHYTFL